MTSFFNAGGIMQNYYIASSKFLSKALKHNRNVNPHMNRDDNGWVSIDTLIDEADRRGMYLNRSIIAQLVDADSKKKYVYNSDRTKIKYQEPSIPF
jgi:putative RNA 2'-phosphotransferase